MARPIVLSNGNLHVGLNIYGEVHDFYYPYVGLENHAAAKSLRHRVGVWTEGRMAWLDDGAWQFTYNYHQHSLIGCIKAYHPDLRITLEFDDCVDSEYDAFIRNIHVINDIEREREIRLFMHQVFDITDAAGNGDTVQYLPDHNAILTYRGARAFIINGQHAVDQHGFDQYSVGLFGIEGHQGTYADADDGILERNNVEHGRVDSAIGFNLVIGAHASARVHYWIAAGKSQRQALDVDKAIRKEGGPLHRILRTNRWWHQWLQPTRKVAAKLDSEFQDSFIKSALIMKAHVDRRGAILASTDTTMLKYARDAYGYCWTRDACYVLWPLIRLGYRAEPEAFFSFCKQVLNKKGYLMHKYQADGALGSSWHPYLHPDGAIAPPIQEDETAITLFMFNEYYQLHKDEGLLRYYYDDFIKKMADFLASYVDPATGLPKPSYDLWEQIFLTTTYSTAIVYASLLAAAELAGAVHDDESAVRWRSAAEDIASNAQKHLYNPERKMFYKGIYNENGKISKNDTVDVSAFYGAFMYNLFPLESDEMKNSSQTVLATINVGSNETPMLTRFENDGYNRVSDDIAGNPWFVTTLWLAQYYRDSGQVDQAKEIVRWCRSHMMDSGVLSEQINPYTGQFVSVAPLAWSQAEYVSTLLDLV